MTFRRTSKHVEKNEADRQTGKQTEKRKDTQTGETDRKPDRRVEKDACCQSGEKHSDSETVKQSVTDTDKAGVQTDGQSDGQTSRQTSSPSSAPKAKRRKSCRSAKCVKPFFHSQILRQ